MHPLHAELFHCPLTLWPQATHRCCSFLLLSRNSLRQPSQPIPLSNKMRDGNGRTTPATASHRFVRQKLFQESDIRQSFICFTDPKADDTAIAYANSLSPLLRRLPRCVDPKTLSPGLLGLPRFRVLVSYQRRSLQKRFQFVQRMVDVIDRALP